MKFVNSVQTSYQRKIKYHLLRAIGATNKEARTYRDWNYGSIKRIVIPFILKRN